MKTHVMVFWAMTSYSLVSDYEHFLGLYVKEEAICFSEYLVISYQAIRYYLKMTAATCFHSLSIRTSALGWLT
jgi:hypothetical protein